MTISEIISLNLIIVTLALIPGSGVALVVTHSVTHGVTNGISVSLGIVLGDIIFILLAILGLSVVAEKTGWLFVTIKYVGAAYLIGFGYTLFRSKTTSSITIKKSNQKRRLFTSFVTGLLLTLGDVKAIFFYASLFPVFVDLENLQITDVIIIILITIFGVGGVKIFYAFSANKVALMSSRMNLDRITKKTAGLFMVGAGSYLMITA